MPSQHPEPRDLLDTSATHPTPTPLFPSPPSMTTPTTTDQSPADIERWRSLFYTSTLSLLVLCPAIMLLPPRKLDLYTLGLGATWFMSAGYVSEVRTGHGLLWHVGRGLPRWNGDRGSGEGVGEGMVAWKGRGEGGDWLDERKMRERESEGKGLGEVIMEDARAAFGREKGEGQ